MEIAAFTILAIVTLAVISICCLMHYLEDPKTTSARRIKARRAERTARRAARLARR